jgi:hypothetical protein
MHYNNHLICTILYLVWNFMLSQNLQTLCVMEFTCSHCQYGVAQGRSTFCWPHSQLWILVLGQGGHTPAWYISAHTLPTSQCATTLWSIQPCLVAAVLQSWWLVTTEAFSLNHLGTWRTWSWDTKNRITFLMVPWPSVNTLIIFRTVHFREFLADIEKHNLFSCP